MLLRNTGHQSVQSLRTRVENLRVSPLQTSSVPERSSHRATCRRTRTEDFHMVSFIVGEVEVERDDWIPVSISMKAYAQLHTVSNDRDNARLSRASASSINVLRSRVPAECSVKSKTVSYVRALPYGVKDIFEIRAKTYSALQAHQLLEYSSSSMCREPACSAR